MFKEKHGNKRKMKTEKKKKNENRKEKWKHLGEEEDMIIVMGEIKKLVRINNKRKKIYKYGFIKDIYLFFSCLYTL